MLHGGYEWLSVKIFGEGRLDQDLPGKSPAFPQASITDPPIPPPRRQSKKHSFFTSIPEIITFLDPRSFRQCFFSFPAIFTQDLSVLFVGTVDFLGLGWLQRGLRRARPNGMTVWSRGRLGCAAAWRCRWGAGLKLCGRPKACSPEKRTHLAALPAHSSNFWPAPGENGNILRNSGRASPPTTRLRPKWPWTPEKTSRPPRNLDHRMIFVANDGVHGAEPWVINPALPAAPSRPSAWLFR